MWVHRIGVGVLVLVAVGIAVDMIPEFASVPADLDRLFQATWLNLALAAYAGVLAVFVVSKVGHRPDGQSLGLLLGLWTLTLTSAVAPTGHASAVGRALFIVSLTGGFVQTLRFWTCFPEPMRLSEVEQLAARSRGGRSWLTAVNPMTARVVAVFLRSRAAKVAFLIAAAVFSYLLSAPDSYAFGMFLRTKAPGEEGLLTAVGLPAVLVTIAFAWTAFRLADPEHRRRVLWIIFATLTLGVWVSAGVVLGALEALTGSELLGAAAHVVTRSYHPVTTAISLTGYAVAIFFSGALDLRPVINKTTVYGAAFLVLTTLFAGVEELFQSQLTTRLGIAEGLGTWLGAAAVAVAMGPVRDRVDRIVKRFGSALEIPGDQDRGHAR